MVPEVRSIPDRSVVGTAGGIGGSTEGCDVCAKQIPQSARFAAMAAE
jgi:hypothetical protein